MLQLLGDSQKTSHLTPTQSSGLAAHHPDSFLTIVSTELTEFHGSPFHGSHAATGVVCSWNLMRSQLFIDVHSVGRSFQVSY